MRGSIARLVYTSPFVSYKSFKFTICERVRWHLVLFSLVGGRTGKKTQFLQRFELSFLSCALFMVSFSLCFSASSLAEIILVGDENSYKNNPPNVLYRISSVKDHVLTTQIISINKSVCVRRILSALGVVGRLIKHCFRKLMRRWSWWLVYAYKRLQFLNVSFHV